MPVFHTKTIESILDPVAQQVNTTHKWSYIVFARAITTKLYLRYRWLTFIHRNNGLISENTAEVFAHSENPDVIDKSKAKQQHECVHRYIFE